ncbi:unnamed protein product [Parascedosporium putredinis]|uniref:DUF676 domain-containing protein n=1 Tax=Parascedosporium putredinis TaxID=1442378 RepID=A0A9P1H5E7_9PEZI|nr:unnamed protein product [Parascedosporium putredinis]CAI7996413.1 unnamed protein product [Parascedosporium putredinis]
MVNNDKPETDQALRGHDRLLPPRATADIIFVHGLNGGPAHTWTGKNDVFWPLQLLVPSLINTPANIIVYGYNADVASWTKDSSPSENFVYQHAQDLRALLYSNDVRDPALEIQRSLYVSTYGIIFLGTPHTGSNLASWGRILQAMSGVVPKKILNTEPVLLKTLKKDNVVLQEINNHFLDIYQRFKIHMVRENKKTDLKYTV